MQKDVVPRLQRIYAGVFGSGLGHITRILSIAQRIQNELGVELLYSTFDEALDLLESLHEHVVHSPSVGVKWNITGGFSGSDTLVRFPAYLFTFSRQTAFEAERISGFNPRVVLSDSRLSTLFAAKARLYPAVTILNQFKILFPPRFRRQRLSLFFERIESDVLGLLWSLSNEVLFPDLPPPYTLGEANVAGTDVAGKVKFTGFMSPKIKSMSLEEAVQIKRLLGFDSRPIVFMQISGPEPTKPPFIESAVKSAQLLSEEFNIVISKGVPFGSTMPSKLRNGVWVYDWCPIKDQLFLLSNMLVARAGHTTLSQCVENAKPAVVVPIYNHSEQLWNAEKFEKMGQGLAIRSEDLNPNRLAEYVRRCYSDPSYLENTEKLQSISKKYDGIGTTIEILKEFL